MLQRDPAPLVTQGDGSSQPRPLDASSQPPLPSALQPPAPSRASSPTDQSPRLSLARQTAMLVLPRVP